MKRKLKEIAIYYGIMVMFFVRIVVFQQFHFYAMWASNKTCKFCVLFNVWSCSSILCAYNTICYNGKATKNEKLNKFDSKI